MENDSLYLVAPRVECPAPPANLTLIDVASAPPPVPYDPEEYRWVPVRRVPRVDGWTEEKQRRFIEVLADTGQVGLAAKEVGMTPQSARKLRRAPHAEAFSRAWDAARQHAGSFLEDVAFERAIEGVEHNVYDEHGEIVCTKRVYNDRLLTFLLRHLKPERYSHEARAVPPPEPVTIDVSLRAMEPQLPAPPEQLLDRTNFVNELLLADVADGKLPNFLAEQRPPKTAARLAAEAIAAQNARGEALLDRLTTKAAGERIQFSREAYRDMCLYLDPSQRFERSNKRFR